MDKLFEEIKEKSDEIVTLIDKYNYLVVSEMLEEEQQIELLNQISELKTNRASLILTYLLHTGNFKQGMVEHLYQKEFTFIGNDGKILIDKEDLDIEKYYLK